MHNDAQSHKLILLLSFNLSGVNTTILIYRNSYNNKTS